MQPSCNTCGRTIGAGSHRCRKCKSVGEQYALMCVGCGWQTAWRDSELDESNALPCPDCSGESFKVITRRE